MPESDSSVLDDILEGVELGVADRARLTALHVRMSERFSDLADRFYERIRDTPKMAALLTGPEQFERLRTTFIDWMSSGLLGPYDRAFYEKRSRIGQRHVEIGLPQQHMFTAMNMIRRAYDEYIATFYDPDEARLVAISVDKLLDLELALMLRHYQLDSEARLVQRERRLRSDRIVVLQTLLAGLAHELRNPLNSARLQFEVLERKLLGDGNADPKLVDTMQAIDQELERLTRLVKEFLAFARPSELAPSDHDVAELIRRVIDAERPLADARGVTVQRVGTDPLVACVDASKLLPAVHNLVRNAIEACSSGGLVTVVVLTDREDLRIAVEDDGPGIPDEIRERIYEPFFTTKQSGTGLGLSIVQSAVSSHGGAIDVRCDGHGTRFEISLPVGLHERHA